MLFKKKISFTEDNFESIVEACLGGNEQAQRILFKQHFSFAKSVCLRYSSSHEEAEEILNESFLKVFQNLAKYDLNQPFKAWLRTILINTSISYYRKFHKQTKDTIRLDDAPYPRFDDNVVERITADEILDLVQQIKPIYRTVFLMYAVDGYSHREISDILQVNEATVRSHFVRARARLQHLIKRFYPDYVPVSWETKSYGKNEN